MEQELTKATRKTVVAVSGSSGLIGSALCESLTAEDFAVKRLIRSVENRAAHDIPWSVDGGLLDPSQMPAVDYVVHLAGESVMGFWSKEKKRRIRESRVVGVENLSKSLAALAKPPEALLVASAIGFYGDRGSEILDEKSPPGSGFLADVCCDLERASEPARAAGIRVVNLRIGIVLSMRGGALRKMLTPFRLGLGGRLGSGQQYTNWVSLTDVIGGILHLLKNESVRGSVNLTAPDPVTNSEFTRTLAKALKRPALLPVPGFILRLLLREQATEIFLSSQRSFPRALIDSGYTFQHPEFTDTISLLLSQEA